MGNIGLIIQREFKTRVRKKTFIVLTILGPILSAALFVVPAFLATLPGDDKIITVLDEPMLLDFDEGKENLKLRYLNPKDFNEELALKFSKKKKDYGFLHIPLSQTIDPDWLASNVKLYREGDVSIGVQNYIENRLEKYLQDEKLKASGVDPQIVARTKTNVNLRTINTKVGTETTNAAFLKMGIGYVTAFLIYMFVFLYGSQVMRGVIEEKTNRIVEVMVSSVKPIELMLGKILGIALVALLQFSIWVVFGALLYTASISLFLGDALNPENISAMGNNPAFNENSFAFDLFATLSTINFTLILSTFLFYFIFGYLLYASLFAGLASVVDKESDAGQFTLPVSLPLIIAIVVLIRAVDDPDGSLAFWFSIIPLTSPIIMLARIPFGVPTWQLILSMTLLLLSFLGAVWAAAKIYRTGILMYGKKPKFSELFKWLTYKNQ
jgi:ABC-2 type transport system permease protein